MYETLHCMALRTVRFSDSRTIVSAWSAERGYVSFAMPSGHGRESQRRRALTMPLATFEGVSDLRPGQEVHFVRDLRPIDVGLTVLADPAKTAVALFLAEVYEKLLRHSAPDTGLNAVVFDTPRALAAAGRRGTANFVLWSLYRLTAPLGIEPDMSGWHRGAVFDLEGARWRDTPVLSPHSLTASGERAAAVRTVSRLTQGNIERIAMTRDVRRAMLDGIIRYYDLHYCTLSPLRSLDVVRELF